MRNFIHLRISMILLFLALGVSCLVGFGPISVAAQTNSTGSAIAPGQPGAKVELPALPEMWVKLPARLDLEKLKIGDTVDAVVGQGWVYHACGVNGGAHVAGEVVAVRAWSDSDRNTEAAIAFTAICQNKDTVPLILIAIYSPTDDSKSDMELESSMPQGIGPGAYGRGIGDPKQMASLPSPGAGDEIFPLAKFGEVKGLHHVSLAVAKGPHGATVISSPDKKFRLDARTRLALVPVP
jgi:hypothetical protein